MTALRAHWWITLAALLGVVAVWQPIGLYLFALAVFGLPHVLWEMAWVRRVWGAALPGLTWICLLGALLLQACARVALWRGTIDGATAAVCDVATLSMAILATLLLLRQVPARQRVLLGASAVLLSLALFSVADTPYVLGVLAVLAIAHNFTPIGLMPAYTRIGPWPARQVMLLLFTAPLVLFVLLWALQVAAPSDAALHPAEWGWVQGYSLRLGSALLPALVWAQCLHYLAVLHLMPRAIGSDWQGLPLRPLALVACGLLLAYFIGDFGAARGLYAVVAGMHAWLELPLILLSVLGLGVRPSRK